MFQGVEKIIEGIIKKKKNIAILLIVLICFLSPKSYAEKKQTRRSHMIQSEKLIAGYLYKLVKYIKWKDKDYKNNIKICIMGKDKVGDYLSKLNKPYISVIKDYDYSKLNSYYCHVLYIDISEQYNKDDILRKTKGLSVLTVSNIPGFARAEGMIEFKSRGRKIKPIVNPNAAKKEGITIFGALLNASEVIRDGN